MTLLTNKDISYTTDKDGNVFFEYNGVECYTKYQPCLACSPFTDVYSHAVYTVDEEWGEQVVGGIEYDILWIDGEDGEPVLATDVFEDESECCNWNEFTVKLN